MMFLATLVIFSTLMLYAAYSDARTYTLPNWISVVLIAGFVLVCLVIQPTWGAIGWHLLVAGIMFTIGFALFATGQFGGGDVKVIAALGLWLGPNNAMSFFIIMAIGGGILAIMLLLYRCVPETPMIKRSASLSALHDEKEGIPYGIAIAFAALLEFPRTGIYSALQAL